MLDRIQLTRRQLVASMAALAAMPSFAQISPSGQQKEYTRNAVEHLLRPLLLTKDPSLFRLAVDAYHQCILGKLRPIEAPFRHTWLAPGGGYEDQWLWDTTFVTDLLAILPGQREIIRGVYQNFWDFCDRWNIAKPEYAHGMVANFIAPFSEPDTGPDSRSGRNWRTFPAYSQAPLLAWGVERVFLRNQDLELVRTALPYLEAFHNWYWRERDITGIGLIAVGSYSGVTQHARYETNDLEVDLDTLQLTAHTIRHGANEGKWYGDILIPTNTAYLLLSEQSLSRLALAVHDHELAARSLARYQKGVLAMREHMWEEDAGCFLAVRRDSLEKIYNPTVGGFTPLMAGVPTTKQAARMAEVLDGPEWSTPLTIPTVIRTDKAFRSDGFWRGDVWPATVYQVTTGLVHYGHHKLAAKIAGANIDNAMRNGISEHYDSITGKPLGVAGLGMSAVVLTMALDGLSPAYQISARKTNLLYARTGQSGHA
jgi:glycogen debranching enzyme